MPEINERVESIFSHAVALQQDGRFRSTIYCQKRVVYILNQDFTVLLRFPLRDREVEFEHAISFRANDYDSRQFSEKDGKILFESENPEYKKTKACCVPSESKQDVRDIWEKAPKEEVNRVTLTSSIFSLMEMDLSHVEMSAKDGVFHAVQRNIFDGSVIDIQKKKARGLLASTDELMDFGPMAVRTNDFQALFAFAGVIDFYFAGTGYVFFRSADPNWKFEGVISQCLYEEMKGNDDGREKPKKRGRQ
jgi:hypothetical protein